MLHTYVSGLVDCVFSTKNRRNIIASEKLSNLWSYLGGIARKNGFKAIAVGGTENHVHVLLSLPATIPLAKAMQLLKGGSSKWMNDTSGGNFAWQEGYAPSRWESLSRPLRPHTLTPRQNIIESAVLKMNSWRS
jgi:REP element-mobilizing transposase RayT